ISIFTFQFVHTNLPELMLSMTLLWLAGHILKEYIGERKVVLLYFACIIFSGVVFLFSHLIFTVFSAGTGMMEGAFCGTLGIMAATVTFNHSRRIRMYGGKFIPLWQVFGFGIAIYLVFFYQHSMAYILVLVSNLYGGFRYALYYQRSNVYELKLKQSSGHYRVH
ncbi:MAG TPA: rhomboid family intramembrane serine protease, partial [Chitinophagaceae bacterium]|nr:rhomboid family intramembrane serine protease [Chitinophagaceae bacterium]